MKVLVDASQAANRSGTGVYVTQLARNLHRVAPDLDVVFAWPSGVTPPPDIPPSRVLHQPYSGIHAKVYNELGGFERLAREIGAGLVHFPATVHAMRCNIPSMVTVHDLSFLHHAGWFRADRAWYYRNGIRNTIHNALEIIAVSDATARDLNQYTSADPDRITVVYNGGARVDEDVSLPTAEEVRERFGLPDSFFLYLGTLEPRKNLVRLVEAWSSIAARNPMDLVLAGRWGWKGGALLDALRRCPCRDRIHLTGFVPDTCLPGLYRAATVFVYPSLWEGFGIPILEAMARGVPVITSDRSSMPEIAGDAALLVDPEKTHALAEAMNLLASDPDRCDELIGRGLAQASRFSWETCARETAGVYRKVFLRLSQG